MCQRIGAPRYDLWFRAKTTFRLEPGHVHVGVPNRFFQEWLQKTFTADVAAAAAEIVGAAPDVTFAIDPELFQAARQREAGAMGLLQLEIQPAQTPPDPSDGQTDRRPDRPGGFTAAPQLRARRWRKLSDFAEGACNRVALAAARHVVEAPGQGPNPLVLHGPVGSGKSHLLEGVYCGLRHAHGDWRVVFVTAEEFTHRFVQAMRLGKLGGFRKQFRDADALLMDDIHFLAKKKATQEEFLYTLDALERDGRPVAVTCDGHPRLADELAPELIDRLMGGAVWDLAYPDPDTRLAILRGKCAGADALPPGVLECLASQLRGNVRELEGAVHSIRHLAKATGRPINVELAREAIANVVRHSVRLVQLVDVDRVVCGVLGLNAGSLQSGKRGWMVSHPRMLAVYLARKHTAATFTEIGHYFGNRNHSTAVAAEKKVRGWKDEDAHLPFGKRPLRVRDVLDRIEQELLR
ncbi:MAG: DnaA/Hda family protein [Gemmataceae bacterium]|nr:DnaA/Hda family protein [Gemmataceae bacterium]